MLFDKGRTICFLPKFQLVQEFIYILFQKSWPDIQLGTRKERKCTWCDLFKLCCDLKFSKCVIYILIFSTCRSQRQCVYIFAEILNFPLFQFVHFFETDYIPEWNHKLSMSNVIDYKNADEIRACLNPLTNNWELQKDARPLEIGH